MAGFLRFLKVKELRNSILMVLGILVLFRFVAHIPVPGTDASSLSQFFQSNQVLGLLNLFSGGTLENFSIVALGVGPYITSSIIFQLLAMIIPSMEEMQKEERGRQKINQWTRIATVPLAFLQGYGILSILSQQTNGLLIANDPWTKLLALTVMTTGTVFLMWLGELISERHIGNGISMLIFAGIIAGLPTTAQQAIATFDRSQLFDAILFVAVMIVCVVGVVYVNESQRNIPIQYARMRQGTRSLGGVNSSLPLKINIGGMIPIIFAISIILFPTTLAQFLIHAKTAWIANGANTIIALFQNQLIYGIAYFVLVFAFTFFYASVVFHPDRIAENLQKQGGFIPGIRPGTSTATYLQWVLNRLLFLGASFLAIIAVMPVVAQQLTGTTTLVVGGASLIIVVSVVIDIVKQIEAQMAMHEYDGA
ncbi:MAG: preprotein translocase subunit SecY [Patescibacteria group bacterium]